MSQTKARSYGTASAMFADFVNFTKIGELLTPEELVFAIGEYFEAFDKIVEKYGVKKIKTVGDAYFCAAGLPIPTVDNATVIIHVAFEFLKAIPEISERRRKSGKEMFGIRIGTFRATGGRRCGSEKIRVRYLGRHGKYGRPYAGIR